MLEAEFDPDARQEGPFPDIDKDGDADRLLPARVYHSLPFQKWEDAAIWSRAWVGIGFEAEVADIGDVLPFTVGNHGIHVERMPDGMLVGRFNKAQHGGCRAVPLQCQTGTRTRCSFTACGYSYDRRPIAASDPDRARHLDQYLGLRPERSLKVDVREWGPVLLTRLDPRPPAPLDWPAPALVFTREIPAGETIWLEVGANWKHVAVALATNDDAARTSLLFPNVVVRTGADETCIILLQPVAPTRTLMRIRTAQGRVPDWVADRAAKATQFQSGQPRLEATPNVQRARDALEARVHQAVCELALEERTDVLFRTDDKGDW
jgi:hypothetical protein